MNAAVRESKVVIVRLSLTLIRNGQMLLVREPGAHYLFDPGGERIVGQDDEETLIAKMKEDLGVEFLRPLDRWRTYKAPAVNKPRGTMVENHCYYPNPHQPPLDLSHATKEIVWWPAPLSPVSEALLKLVQEEGLVTPL